MSRTPRDEAYAVAFGKRLAQVLSQLDIPISRLGRDLGYRDGSTLHAALSGRCVLDVERLVKLSAWCRARGCALNLHWLLTGEAVKVAESSHVPALSGWLTPERRAAIGLLADGVADLPQSSRPRKKGATRAA